MFGALRPLQNRDGLRTIKFGSIAVPELPEVETTVGRIRPKLVRRHIAGIECSWRRTLCGSPATAARVLRGARIEAVGRRGKFVRIDTVRADATRVAVLIHLRMSGRLEVQPSSFARPAHTRLCVALDGGDELRFVDARKFGRVWVTREPEAVLGRVGVEPLSDGFTPDLLRCLLAGRSRVIKSVLLDQAVVAGLGNIYVDESLFRARLHPRMRSDRLSRRQCERLHRAIQSALRDGIAANGASIDWVYPGGSMQDRFAVYGRGGQPCPACQTAVVRMVVAQRGTHICPRCQRIRTGFSRGHRSTRNRRALRSNS